MDVAAGRKVHDRVGAPRIAHTIFSTSSGNAGAHRRIADVGVDLDEKISADRHRLEFEVVDVGRNDRPPSGDLAREQIPASRTREYRRRSSRRRRCGPLPLRPPLLAREFLTMGDIDHLFRDDPGAGKFELGDELTALARAQRAHRGAERRKMVSRHIAVVLRPDRARLRKPSPRPRSTPRARTADRRQDRSAATLPYRVPTDRRPSPAARSGR